MDAGASTAALTSVYPHTTLPSTLTHTPAWDLALPFKELSDFMFDRREGDGARQGNASTWEKWIRGSGASGTVGRGSGNFLKFGLGWLDNPGGGSLSATGRGPT